MRACPLCKHSNITEINRRLITGADAAEIARDYGVPHRSAMHHKRYHLPRLLKKVREVDQQLEATALRKILIEIGVEMRGLYEAFKKTKDFRGAIVALDKLLGWWQTAATMEGIAEPPEGHRETPIDVRQAARDLYGLGEEDMPSLDGEQRALPPADAAPQEPEETPAPAPVAAPAVPAQEQYRKTSAEIAEGHFEVAHDPDIERKLRAAKPVQDPEYLKLLNRAHADGRRLEVGEASHLYRRPTEHENN